MPVPAGGTSPGVGATAYTTLPLLKKALGGVTRTDVDDLLNDAIETASRQIDAMCERRFYLDVSASARIYSLGRRLYQEREGDRIQVDDVGSAVGLVVEYGNIVDGWTAITAESQPDNALVLGQPITSLRLATRVPIGATYTGSTTRLRVTAVWGWPSIPSAVGRAALIQAARLFKRQDSPEGVLGSAEWGVMRIGRIDPDVAALLQPYMTAMGFA